LAVPLKVVASGGDSPYRCILIPKGGHPALKSAAEIMARGLAIAETGIKIVAVDSVPGEGEIALTASPAGPRQQRWLEPQPGSAKFDRLPQWRGADSRQSPALAPLRSR
ncbi:MAG: hypothetical protein ACRD4O_18735, partial [Bryobacteraceae bacterium]